MTEKKPAAAKKPAAKKAPAAEAAPKETSPYALVSKFGSHGSQYTILRISRETGEKLKAGTRYGLKVSEAGVITLTPKA
jgi:hypothetical protein